MPVGEYLLEDGKIVVIEEEGTIADFKEAAKEDKTEAEEEETEDLGEDEEKKEEMGYATKEELAEVKNMIEEIKAMLEPKEDLSNEGQAPLKSRTVKEEFSEDLKEVTEQVKEELSEAAAKPIKHNPEAQSKQTRRVEFGRGKFETTLDKVMAQISKIKN